MDCSADPQDAAELTESPAPHKRQKRSHDAKDASSDPTSKKGKSCSTCRRLKVKCDAAEKGTGSCSRCLRLGIQCLSERKTWTSADGEERPSDAQLAITKLERAMEDVLQRLGLPALDLYSPTTVVEHFRSTDLPQQPAQDPVQDGDEVSQGPMNSLIEATRMNSLRSQLRSVKLRRKGGMRRMEADLVSEHALTLTEAEDLLELFKTSLSSHLFSASIPPHASLNAIRTSSTVLFTSTMMVTALHVPGKEALHETCHSRFLNLVSSAIFDHFHTLDDIRGLAVAAFWQPDLSWKLSGIAIRMATELNLHHAFHEVFHTDEMSEDNRNECLEKARLWYLLYVLDHQSSVAYGRPPVMAELRPIRDYEALLRSPFCTDADRGLLARVAGCATLSRAFETFGLEPKRTMGGDDASVLTHMRYTEDIQNWRNKWAYQSDLDSSIGMSLLKGVELHYHFSQLVLNSLVLRGRSLEELDILPTSLRPLALQAVIAGTSILEHFTSDSAYRESIVGMPLYLHSMIAFAVVFLLKLSSRWHKIGITINPSEQILPLIQDIIEMLRSCKAGANHMVFSMANGFERMLKQLSRNQHEPRQAAGRNNKDLSKTLGYQGRHDAALSAGTVLTSTIEGSTKTATTSSRLGRVPEQLSDSAEPAKDAAVADLLGLDYAPSDFAYSDWEIPDGELWDMAMGYDLLAPGLRLPTGTDSTQSMYASTNPAANTPFLPL